jgi:nucleotide-binding universal stress UspA family protein
MSEGTAAPVRRLLVVCEEDSTALLRLADRLAGTLGAEPTLLAVVPEAPLPPRASALVGDAPGARLAREAEEKLEALAAGLGHPAERVVRTGRAFLEILGEAVQGEHDLVLKMADDRPGLHARLLGSTDQHLLRKCPVPLWLERPAGDRRGLLAALDVDLERAPEPDTLRALNERIGGLAAALAAALDEPLHLAHAWDAPEEPLLRRWTHDTTEVDAYLRAVETQRGQLLDVATRDVERRVGGGCRVVPHLRRGDPRDVLPALVEELDARLLLAGTVARTGIPGLLIGNTAEDVLNDVRTSLLAVKPEGFVCPVAPPPRRARASVRR